MGVRRLTALLETHRDIYHDGLFGNNRLVIDGCDLIKQLYFDSGRTQSRPPSSRSASKQADNKNRFKYRARLKRNRISSLECCFVYSTLTSALRGAVSWSQDTSEILTPRRNVWEVVAIGYTARKLCAESLGERHNLGGLRRGRTFKHCLYLLFDTIWTFDVFYCSGRDMTHHASQPHKSFVIKR